MPTLPVLQVDAFTDRPLAGNPCAAVLDTDGLPEETMQAIAREMNRAETAFVPRSAVADVGARYFTPAEEIPMAGHPTITTVFALAELGRLPLAGDTTTVSLDLRVGPIRVDILASEGRVRRVVMSQKPPRFLAEHDPDVVLPAFRLSPADALRGVPIQTVGTGTPQPLVPLRDHAALRRARLDVGRYEALRAVGDVFSPHLFCLGGATATGQTFARHVGAPPDAMEAPFAGSATGGMAAYLWRHGLIDEPAFGAEQGRWLGRPGRTDVEVVGPPDAMTAVRVGGAAVTVLRGELTI